MYLSGMEPQVDYVNGNFTWYPPLMNTASPAMQRDCWSLIRMDLNTILDNGLNRYILHFLSTEDHNIVKHNKSVLLPFTPYSQHVNLILPNGATFNHKMTMQDRNNNYIAPYTENFTSEIVGSEAWVEQFIPSISLLIDNEYEVCKVRSIEDYSGASGIEITDIPNGFMQIWIKDGDANITINKADAPIIERPINPSFASPGEVPTYSYPINPSATDLIVKTRMVYPGQQTSSIISKNYKKKTIPFVVNTFGLDFRSYAPFAADQADDWNLYNNGVSYATNGQTFFMGSLEIDATTSMVSVRVPIPNGMLTEAKMYNYFVDATPLYGRLVLQENSDFELDFSTPINAGVAPNISEWSGNVPLSGIGDVLHFYTVKDPDHQMDTIDFRGRLVLYITRG